MGEWVEDDYAAWEAEQANPMPAMVQARTRAKTMERKFGIWCEVSGGITGYRAAWLKSDDKETEFSSAAEAQTEAARLSARNVNPYSTASYKYSVRERLKGTDDE